MDADTPGIVSRTRKDRILSACATTLALFVSATSIAAAGQLPDKIDYRRDVQPILRERCVSCHGPELQMNGLRLDRRADALRGGTQSDIGPGNAEGSRLYHRLIGTRFGPQMPPGKPLPAAEVETIKRWIDEGADWPDDAAGAARRLPADPDALRLMAAIRAGDRRTIDDLLRSAPFAVQRHGVDGATPLMAAALYGDRDLIARLLSAGADPNASDSAGGTALMWAVPDRDKMKLLLDAGADANARSEEGRTAVVVSSGTVGADAALKLLLDYGADPSPWHASDPSPLREAARVDDAEMFGTLLEWGVRVSDSRIPSELLRTNCARCAAMVGAGGPLPRRPPPEPVPAVLERTYDPNKSSRPTPVGASTASPDAIREAIARSLPLLQQVDVDFVKHTGCVSCHHNSLVAMAVTAARSHGYRVDDGIALSQSRAIGTYLESWRARTLQNAFIAGQTDTISYLLFGLVAAQYPPDAATDAQAIWLKRRQAADGRWPLTTIRPPIESNDIEVTAVSMRALQVFAPPAQRAEFTKAVERARSWLTTAKAASTEERAYRLLGLSWGGASRDVLNAASRDLLSTQRADGGWAQLDDMPLSDAYATGEALVALRESGSSDLRQAAYRKGVEFLLRTQIEDGSWFVETRAVPIQAGFASGFPYGVHQWISAAATAWATTALALSN